MDEELGNQLVATMLYLDSENKQDLTLYINCAGGEVQNSPFSISCGHTQCVRFTVLQFEVEQSLCLVVPLATQ